MGAPSNKPQAAKCCGFCSYKPEGKMLIKNGLKCPEIGEKFLYLQPIIDINR